MTSQDSDTISLDSIFERLNKELAKRNERKRLVIGLGPVATSFRALLKVQGGVFLFSPSDLNGALLAASQKVAKSEKMSGKNLFFVAPMKLASKWQLKVRKLPSSQFFKGSHLLVKAFDINAYYDIQEQALRPRVKPAPLMKRKTRARVTAKLPLKRKPKTTSVVTLTI